MILGCLKEVHRLYRRIVGLQDSAHGVIGLLLVSWMTFWGLHFEWLLRIDVDSRDLHDVLYILIYVLCCHRYQVSSL